jgi:ketosteroid isomerase-like protein
MQSPLEALNEYYKTFSTLDLNAIVSHFSEPCMSIGPQGVFSAGNRAGLANAFRPFVDGLKAKGYARSEFVEAQVTTLGDTAALVRGVAVRYKLDESELERVPISYLMHRSADGWKIATMVLPT